MIEFKPFSKKQLAVLTWWCKNSPYNQHDAIICDGAVRSGKTLCMSISFVSWAFANFEGKSFAICGKTVTSLRRNVTTPLINTLSQLGFVCLEKVSKNIIEVELGGRKNTFYLFGGKDESSAALIQGITLAGVLLDEVALMPRSFVEQALARCSVEGSKFWFNCNPEHPFHWFYLEWIKKSKQKNALYVHFLMEDNPSLSRDILRRYQSLYSGTFFERFVMGKWVVAQGLVYGIFDQKKHVTGSLPKDFEEFYVSCDYGTVNPMSIGLWGRASEVWYRIEEYYYNSRLSGQSKTDEEYYEQLLRLAEKKEIKAVVVDPSAASFIECIRRHQKFKVIPAKNDVISGIQRVSNALKQGKILFSDRCKDSIREFSLYVWDEKARGDTPKKENDHAMDDIRYFVNTVMDKNETNDFFVLSAQR
ncbi:MAG: family phage terminase large subunit [Oscillospiraceae bacterium]|nr:family phage terminase large subunit [Oscillospiraceae bacterium]